MEQDVMKIESRIKAAEQNLDWAIGWFSKFNNRVSVVAAIDTAMLGSLVVLARSSPFHFLLNISLISSLVLLGTSLGIVVVTEFPYVIPPKSRLIYYGSVAEFKSSSDFEKEFNRLTEENYLDALLEQIWIVSKLVSRKFKELRISIVLTAVAVIPWLAALAIA